MEHEKSSKDLNMSGTKEKPVKDKGIRSIKEPSQGRLISADKSRKKSEIVRTEDTDISTLEPEEKSSGRSIEVRPLSPRPRTKITIDGEEIGELKNIKLPYGEIGEKRGMSPRRFVPSASSNDDDDRKIEPLIAPKKVLASPIKKTDNVRLINDDSDNTIITPMDKKETINKAISQTTVSVTPSVKRIKLPRPERKKEEDETVIKPEEFIVVDNEKKKEEKSKPHKIEGKASDNRVFSPQTSPARSPEIVKTKGVEVKANTDKKEVEKRGGSLAVKDLVIPDYASMSEDELIDNWGELRAKYNILRKTFPEHGFPEVPRTVTLSEIKKNIRAIHVQYENDVREIHINNNTSKYRIYLIMLWIGIEYGLTKTIGEKAKGYTLFQMNSMDKYNKLLIEIGVKYTKSEEKESEWPVEVRLIFVALVQAAIFIGISYASEYVGESNGKMIGDFLSDFLSGKGNSIKAIGGSEKKSSISSVPAAPGINFESIISNFGPQLMSMFSGGKKSDNDDNKSAETSKKRSVRKPTYTE